MIVGIDLGTTNSAIAVFDGESQLVANSVDSWLTPSVVNISEDGMVLVGQAAKERLVTHPDNTFASFKRFMGTTKSFHVGKLNLKAEDLSALVLQALVEDVESQMGEKVTQAVVSVPAYFNDTQRQATVNAAKIAGLPIARLINEPTAASLAYHLHRKEDSYFLVFDLGGGTFDVSVLEWFEGVMEVHASTGDNSLGGDDFTKALQEIVVSRLGKLDATELGSVWRQCESAKVKLNELAQASVVVGDQIVTITADEYHHAVQPLLDRLARPVRRALRDARVRPSDLEEVVLVGGGTKKVLVQQMVEQMFGRIPLSHIDPDTVVALGAAVQAGLCSKHDALEDVVLTDVCPYSLGIEIVKGNDSDGYVEGVFSPIIERNTIVPVSRVETYHALHDDQRQLKVSVYQGESNFVKDNVYLGSVEVRLPSRGAKTVDVRFTYDTSGLLEVTCRNTGGELQTIILEQNSSRMTPSEVKARLKTLEKLKKHPREDHRNVALIARGDRLYSELLGEERALVGHELQQFAVAVETQDPRTIRKAYKRLEEFLAQAEAYL